MNTLPLADRNCRRRADVGRSASRSTTARRCPRREITPHRGRSAAATVCDVRSRRRRGRGEEEGHEHHCLRISRAPQPSSRHRTDRCPRAPRSSPCQHAHVVASTTTISNRPHHALGPPHHRHSLDEPDDDGITYSTYPDAAHGPAPLPDWVATSPAAIDTDLGVFKTGKEADVSLIRRTHGDRSVLLAAKQYRDVEAPDVPPRRRLPRRAPHAQEPRDQGGRDAHRVRSPADRRAVGGGRVRRAVATVAGGRRRSVPGAAVRHGTDDGVHR